MIRLHHANIIGERGDFKDFVFKILKKDLNFEVNANPDFLLLETEVFGIDDVRGLEKWVSGKPFLGEVKVSLVIANSITLEAQNALLKTLEEPPIGTYIFINLQSLAGLLGTFLSRVRVLDVQSVNSVENDSKKFLNAKIKERLSLVNKMYKNETRPTGSSGWNKNVMKEFIKDLEFSAYKEKRGVDMKKILTAKILAESRGSSPRMLLEWLSCVL